MTEVDMSTEDVRRAIFEAEEQILERALQIEFSSAVAELKENRGWKHIIDRLESAWAKEVDRLMLNRLDDYMLGRAQGRLRTLRMLLDVKPLPEEDLAKLQQDVTVLQNQLSQYRNLI